MVKKQYCIILQIMLLLWFFLDMIGFYIGDKCLVTRSYKDDGIFFVLFFVVVVLFIIKEKVGKWLTVIWLTMWFVIQFICHEWYTIFNEGFMGSLEDKMKYFSGTIQWLEIRGRYIPDVYHTILHILILCVLVCTTIYAIQNKKK